MKNKWILNFLLIALSINAASPLLANKENVSKSNPLSCFIELSGFKKIGNTYFWVRDFVDLFGSVKYGRKSDKKCKDVLIPLEKQVEELNNDTFYNLSNQEKLNIVQKLKADLEEKLIFYDDFIQTLARYTDVYSHIEKVATLWQLENKYNFGHDRIQIRDLNDCCNVFAKFTDQEFEIFIRDLEIVIDEYSSWWKNFTNPRYQWFGVECLDLIQRYLRIQTLKSVVDECYEKITSELK